MACATPPMVVPDLNVRLLSPTDLAVLLERHRLLVGLRAMYDYVSREPGKVERCAQHDFPVFLSVGVPMTTPALMDDHLLACDRRARQLRRPSA
jgi:hypothetical protein